MLCSGIASDEEVTTEGAKLVTADGVDAEGQAAAQKLKAHYQHCDVSKSAHVNALVAATVRLHGAVDILVNNAGISIAGDFLEITEEQFDTGIGVNLKGSFLMAPACAREMGNQMSAGPTAGARVSGRSGRPVRKVLSSAVGRKGPEVSGQSHRRVTGGSLVRIQADPPDDSMAS